METILGIIVGLAVGMLATKLLPKKDCDFVRPAKSHLLRSRQIVLDMDYDKVVEKSKNAVRLFKLKLTGFDSEKGELRALSAFNFRSYGEKIIISHKKVSGGVEVTIESMPAVPYVFLDYGRNQSNVDALYELIKN